MWKVILSQSGAQIAVKKKERKKKASSKQGGPLQKFNDYIKGSPAIKKQ